MLCSEHLERGQLDLPFGWRVSTPDPETLLETEPWRPDLQLRYVAAQVSSRGETGNRLRTVVRNLECEPCVMILSIIKHNFCYTNDMLMPSCLWHRPLPFFLPWAHSHLLSSERLDLCHPMLTDVPIDTLGKTHLRVIVWAIRLFHHYKGQWPNKCWIKYSIPHFLFQYIYIVRKKIFF